MKVLTLASGSSRQVRILVAPLVVAVLAGMSLPAAAAPPSPGADGGRYIVRYAEDADRGMRAASNLASEPGVEIDAVFGEVFDGFAGHLPDDVVERLRDDPRVASIEEDVEITLYRQGPGSPEAAGAVTSAAVATPPWGLDRIDQRELPLSGAYTAPNDGAGVTAYIVDTGIRSDHVEFGGRVGTGFNAVDDGFGAGDCDGHGTHVAGTVGGSTVGVASAVDLQPVRVFPCDSEDGDGADLIQALDWIVAHHEEGEPAVANLSLGGDASDAVDAAVQAVIDDGVTVVAAAGNDGVPACTASPARLDAVLTVGATDASDHSPGWSNYGSCLDLFAPGESILSAWPSSDTTAARMGGTSMASPHAAGVAATILADDPDSTPAQVTGRILTDTTLGSVSDAGSGSPNRLLYASSTAPAAPANDDFADADVVSLADPGPITASSVHAGAETGEPTHADVGGGRSVWWTFTAPTSGEVQLSTEGSSFDTVLAVYTGSSVSTLTDVAANDDSDPALGRWSGIDLEVAPGETYHVAVDGFDGAWGPIELHVDWWPEGTPAAPTDVVATPGDGRATVSWLAPPSLDGEGVITGYTVAASPGGATVDVPADVSSADVTGLTNDASHRFHVRATNAAGAGPWSAASDAVTPRRPGPPACLVDAFSDVPVAHPFCAEIAWLAAGGITTGYSDGTFRPSAEVNRQAIAAFLYRQAGEPVFTPPSTPSFTDVPADHPFFTEIEWLAADGTTSGYPDGTFRPAASVSRQAVAAFLFRRAGEPAVTPSDAPTFADVAGGHPFRSEIEWLAEAGVTTGYPDGGFRPSADVRRQAVAAFLERWSAADG